MRVKGGLEEDERRKGSQLVMAVHTCVLRRWFPGPLGCANVRCTVSGGVYQLWSMLQLTRLCK